MHNVHAHTHQHSHTDTPRHTNTDAQAHTQTHTHAQTRPHRRSHTETLTDPHAHAHTRAHTNKHTRTLTHTRVHKHTYSPPTSAPCLRADPTPVDINALSEAFTVAAPRTQNHQSYKQCFANSSMTSPSTRHSVTFPPPANLTCSANLAVSCTRRLIYLLISRRQSSVRHASFLMCEGRQTPNSSGLS